MRVQFDTDQNADISMSPLIDCVFLLLIFFLVATMVKKKDKDINVDLPVSTSAVKLKPDDSTMVIGINDAGEFYYDGAPTTVTELHQLIAETASHSPDTRVRIDTDVNTPFHRFVEVLDICRFRNLNNVGLRTYDEHYNQP